jgi:hypothetical protein
VQTGRVSDEPSKRDMIVTGAGLALAAFFAAPAGYAAPELAGVMTPITTYMAQKVGLELRRKSNVIAENAVRSSGFDAQELGEALVGNPEMIALTQKIVHAASVTRNEQKLRAFGTLLGAAARHRDGEQYETNLLIDALAAIEGGHVIVMDVLSEPSPDPEGRPGWLASHVQEHVAIEPDLVLGILNTLVNHGLAIPDQNNYGSIPFFEVTSLGRTLADLMRSVASDPGSEAVSS